jgi:hypothetical protein
MRESFLNFCNEVEGYTFHSKKTGYQIYRFEMYWICLSPKECFDKFETRVIIKNRMSYE